MLKRKWCEKENEDVCAISLEPLSALPNVRELPCGHRFCAESLRKALLISPLCPMCRACSDSGEPQKLKKPKREPEIFEPEFVIWTSTSHGNWTSLDPLTGEVRRAQYSLDLETGETLFDIFSDDSDTSSIDYEDDSESD